MIHQIAGVALSSAAMAAAVATPVGKFDGDEHLGAANDLNPDNDDKVATAFDENGSLDSEHRKQMPTAPLQNPSHFLGSTDDSDGAKDASYDSSTVLFDASMELGILDSDWIPSQHVASGRGLVDDCGDDRPLIGADVDFKKLVDVCLNSEALCIYKADLRCWNTSRVTNMNKAFDNARRFNQNIGSWDTSQVTDMHGMFQDSIVFNQPIDSWDTSAVTDMSGMFYKASTFNQPIGSWQTSAVSNMKIMFAQATLFNQPIDSWDTSAVQRMNYMFSSALSFNQPLDSWDTSAVTQMHLMFWEASSFNQCLSTWADKTGNDLTVSYMFSESGCPYQRDPNPSVGPWCQGNDQQCSNNPSSSSYNPPSSANSLSAARLASAVTFGVLIPSIASFVF